MLKDDQINTIIQYSCNQLPASKKAAVEKAIQSSTTYATEFEAYNNLLTGFRALENDHFQKKMQRWEKKYQQESQLKVVSSKLGQRWAIAASLLVMMLSLWGYKQYNNKLEASDFFADYYAFEYTPDPYQDLILLRNSNYFITGTQLISKKQYELSLNAFKNYLNSDQNISISLKVETYFYMGIAALESKLPEEAVIYFKKVTNYQNSDKYEAAEWYLALALLKSEQYELFWQHIEDTILNNPKHQYHKQSLQLQNDLIAFKATVTLK